MGLQQLLQDFLGLVRHEAHRDQGFAVFDV
jgi:hypothetical protein